MRSWIFSAAVAALSITCNAQNLGYWDVDVSLGTGGGFILDIEARHSSENVSQRVEWTKSISDFPARWPMWTTQQNNSFTAVLGSGANCWQKKGKDYA
jgi:hypothetical protein